MRHMYRPNRPLDWSDLRKQAEYRPDQFTLRLLRKPDERKGPWPATPKLTRYLASLLKQQHSDNIIASIVCETRRLDGD